MCLVLKRHPFKSVDIIKATIISTFSPTSQKKHSFNHLHVLSHTQTNSVNQHKHSTRKTYTHVRCKKNTRE